jgi:hypothetical protein
MPCLTPSDIKKSGRGDFAGISHHLGLEETAWQLREAARAFVNRSDGNFANRRRALVAAMAEETGRVGRRRRRSGFLTGRRQTDRSRAGWRAMAMAPTAIIPGGNAALRIRSARRPHWPICSSCGIQSVWRTKMDYTKQRKLVQRLVDLTRVGSIDWKPSTQANMFQVSFQESTLRIGLKEGRRQEDEGIMIQLVTGDGVVVESFTNVDLQPNHTCINPQPWFRIMMDLFEEARRRALGADREIHERVINEILSGLDVLTLTPRPTAIEKRLAPTQRREPPFESQMHAISMDSLASPDRLKEYGDPPEYGGGLRYAC